MLVTLTNLTDHELGDELTIVWEVEPGREKIPALATLVLTRSDMAFHLVNLSSTPVARLWPA